MDWIILFVALMREMSSVFRVISGWFGQVITLQFRTMTCSFNTYKPQFRTKTIKKFKRNIYGKNKGTRFSNKGKSLKNEPETMKPLSTVNNTHVQKVLENLIKSRAKN